MTVIGADSDVLDDLLKWKYSWWQSAEDERTDQDLKDMRVVETKSIAISTPKKKECSWEQI